MRIRTRRCTRRVKNGTLPARYENTHKTHVTKGQETVRLIIDTDAGVDDAQAIMLALDHADVTVEAITTLTGNVHVDWVTKNVFTVLEVMQAGDIPVYRGAAQPLVPGNWKPETQVHGSDGLGNLRKRPSTKRTLEAEPAAVALIRLANTYPGELTLIALGPLTNIALACRLDPDFPQKIKQFVFMGGTISAMGNTPNLTAEFNIYIDPEAAAVTLAAFAEATMLSWETTLHHPFTWEQYDDLAFKPTSAAQFFRETTLATVEYLRQFRQVPGYLLPDPLAMAVVLKPDIVQESNFQSVRVELMGSHTRGQTVIDHFGISGQKSNVHIVTKLDTSAVYAMYAHMLS
jgi:purine nucleosidase